MLNMTSTSNISLNDTFSYDIRLQFVDLLWFYSIKLYLNSNFSAKSDSIIFNFNVYVRSNDRMGNGCLTRSKWSDFIIESTSSQMN